MKPSETKSERLVWSVYSDVIGNPNLEVNEKQQGCKVLCSVILFVFLGFYLFLPRSFGKFSELFILCATNLVDQEIGLEQFFVGIGMRLCPVFSKTHGG